MHRHDDPRPDRIEQGGDQGEVDRRRAAGRDEHDVGPPDRRQLGLVEFVAEVAEEDRRANPRPGKWTIATSSPASFSGDSKTRIASNRTPATSRPPSGSSIARTTSNGGTIWPRWLW